MGYVGSVRALVTYSLSESEDAQKETLESSFLGVLPFLTPAQYEEATATYRVFFINIQNEWIIYIIAVLVLTVLPYKIGDSLAENLNKISKKKRV